MAAFALVTLGVLGWRMGWPHPVTRWRLPGGTTLTYLGFTCGTRHPSPLRFPWERWPIPTVIARWLPAKGWGPERPGYVPELRLWFRSDRDFAPGDFRWDLVDESGFSIADFFESHLVATNGQTGLRLDFGIFPRAGAQLRLVGRHRDRESGRFLPVMELEVPNPKPEGRSPRSVTNSPLPQTVSSGDVEFTLTRFETGLNGRPGYQRVPAARSEEPVACLDFVTAIHRVPNRDWFPLRMRAEDMEGHILPVSPREWLTSANGWTLKIQPAPWAGPTWRLRVEFSRNEGFAPEEQVVFRNLRLASLEGLDVNQSAWVGQRGVELRFLKRVHSQNREWGADARLGRREPGVSLTLVEARDQLGQKLWRHPRHLTFRALSDSETVDLTFAVHESRFAEFQATPVDVRKP